MTLAGQTGRAALLVISTCSLWACSDDTTDTQPVTDATNGQDFAGDAVLPGDVEDGSSAGVHSDGAGFTDLVAADSAAPVDTGPVLPPPTYPMDDVLRVNQIQVKGTHNSYHLKNGPTTIPQWNYEFDPLDVQLGAQGVRQLELDVHYTPGKPKATWEVLHVPFVDPKSTCPDLSACLGIIKTWSDGHPGHHLLFILIEPKDVVDTNKIVGHYDELDAAILAVWPKPRVLLPDDVRGGHKTLRDALEKDGWPTLGQTRDKAMFIMLDSGSHRANYLKGHENLQDRVIFMRDGQGEPWSSVLETSDTKKVAEAVKLGYLVRSKADDPNDSDADNEARSKGLLAAGAQLISSDVPVAKGDKSYQFDIPGGTPSGCNPLLAPADCTAAAVEALAQQ